jgi:polyphosphate kinase
MGTALKSAEMPVDGRSLYINRELSWLEFNRRVLDQAADLTRPLLERMKFVAIFGSNLDEFFMIRVSGLNEQLDAGVDDGNPDGMTAREQLRAIRKVVQAETHRAAKLLSDALMPALAHQRIHVESWSSLSEPMRKWARRYFRESVFPLLTPLAVDPVHPFPFVSNLSLSLAVEVTDPVTAVRRFARVKIPESLPRFVLLGHATGEGAHLLPLEGLVAQCVEELFPGMVIEGSYLFRITRDMDIDILEEEASDLLSVVDREIRRRRFGAAVRLEVAPELPARIRLLLLEKLEIDEDDVYETEGLLGLSGLFSIASLPRPDLKDPPLIPRPPIWADPDTVFATIARGDILLHHPYDGFASVLEFLRAAAEDPEVLAIKMTLYRAGAHSETAVALVRAAESGKQVAVSIELKARFDEENNIEWARALERAGAHVFYGTSGLKTHAKMLLVVRREGHALRRYVHMSTGNYNASTAKFYTDIGLLTCDPAIGADASEFFNALSGFSRSPTYQKLAVAPLTLRATVLAKVDAQLARARAGKPARVFAKLNALVDKEVIDALYAASEAGVSVDLVVRGICCMRPGLARVSDNIRVRSLIGRFLEHERVLVFGVGDEEEFFLTSADWMPRNLDRRVEILFPVESEALRERLRREVMDPLEHDNCRVYEMGPDGHYSRRSPPASADPVDAQQWASQAGFAAGRPRK